MSGAERGLVVRWLWMGAGWLSLALGIIGIFLPLLPTTPFVLLAAYCFQRGSERLHRWIVTHPRFRPLIADWHERGAISPRAKRTAMVALVVVVLISWVAGVRSEILLLQVVILTAVATFILTRPD